MKRKDTEYFVAKAKEKHSDRYDYSDTKYINARTKVIILCSLHGNFSILPYDHLKGKKCRQCATTDRAKKRVLGKKVFQKKAAQVHNNKYDYSKVKYKRNKEKVIIICPDHGEFEQIPNSHLLGNGCRKCGFVKAAAKLSASKKFLKRKTPRIYKSTVTKEEFIKRANKFHKNKYSYEKTSYRVLRDKITIGCPKHGDFEQKAMLHLKYGCFKCGVDKRASKQFLTIDEFIKKSKSIHGEKYDYSQTEYTFAHAKVEIICKKHGSFQQKAYGHMAGHGCPYCRESRGERRVANILDDLNISYRREFVFSNCKNTGFLKFDFYLPDFKLCIEYDGEQHFYPLDFFGGEGAYFERLICDNIKNQYCKDNGLDLLRISYFIEDVKGAIMEVIKNLEKNNEA